MKAIANKVLIEPQEGMEGKTPGGIVVPENTMATGWAIVRSVGPEVPDNAGLEEGTHVAYNKQSGAELNLNGKKLMNVRYDLLEGILNPAEAK